MSLDKIIQARRSIREYKTKKPDWRQIIEAIDSMRYAPMAGGIFTLKFILVEDQEKIQKLADAAQQPFVGTASYIVVVCSKPTRTINAYEERGEMYVRQQAGAAIQNFLLKITELGLSTCRIGLFVDNMVKNILKIPNDVQVEAMFPIGFAVKKPKPIQKIDIDSCLYFDEYENKKMKVTRKIDS